MARAVVKTSEVWEHEAASLPQVLLWSFWWERGASIEPTMSLLREKPAGG